MQFHRPKLHDGFVLVCVNELDDALLLRLQPLQSLFRVGDTRIQIQGAAIIVRGGRGVAKPFPRETPVEVSESEALIKLNGLGEIGNGPIVLAGIEVGVAPVVGDQRIARVEREGGIVVGEGAIVLGALGVHIGPVEVGGGQVFGRTFAEPYVRRAAAKLTIRASGLPASSSTSSTSNSRSTGASARRDFNASNVSAFQTPPFSIDPPPPYTEREKELSDMRARITQAENERQQLIEEMKAKNFEIGSLFLD